MKNKNAFLAIIVLAILILGTVYSLFIRPSYYRFNGGQAYFGRIYSEDLSEEFISMATINGYLYECSKNGLIKKEATGEQIWAKSYFMEFPLLVHKGSYLAVAEITGKKVLVFNEEGYLYDVDVSYPILDIYINEGGFLSVVEEDGDQNYIHYFNEEGKDVVEKATVFIKEGYPIDHATSPDVEEMVTGYLNVSENKLVTSLSYFSYDDEYEDSEYILGSYKYEDSLLDRIIWKGEDLVMSVMDNRIVVANLEAGDFEQVNMELEAKVKEVVAADDFFAVWYGDVVAPSEDGLENTITVYDYDGKLLKTHNLPERILGLYEGKTGFYVVTASQVIHYKEKNTEWFASTYLSIDDFYYIDEDRFLTVTGNSYELLEMQERD